MNISIGVASEIDLTPRVRQVSAMFDAPASDKLILKWDIDLPIEDHKWNIGLIVGPSGAGKSTVMRSAFGEPTALDWVAKSVVDDFDREIGIEKIVDALSSVGFNTIPAWMRPFSALSNGERFRVELARRLLSDSDPIVIDEFTSVVDRQVAQIGSHAVQKYVRRLDRRFVAVTCHYDVIDWLQPDWILDMATRQFTRRSLQRRPAIECVVARLSYAAWSMFAPFHYLTKDLNRAARCYGLWANGNLAAFAGVLFRTHPKVRDIYGVSRLVTLPDWQGLGLAFALVDAIGSAHSAIGRRLRTYPAHPSLVRGFEKSTKWNRKKEAGTYSSVGSQSFGGRPCGVYEYVGEKLDRNDAERLLGI